MGCNRKFSLWRSDWLNRFGSCKTLAEVVRQSRVDYHLCLALDAKREQRKLREGK